MKERIRIELGILLSLSMLLTGAAAFASGEAAGASGQMGGPSGEADAELQALIEETVEKFEVSEYTDEETGLTVSYNIYVPALPSAEPSAEGEALPMVVFIPDSSVVGRGAEAALTQGWGGIVWASEAEQEKHPCIVMVPVFEEVILDDHNGFVTTDYIDLVPRMILSVAEKYGADTDRIYATGQSMGCMTFLITAASEPELFAAELFVDGQWDISELKGLESQKFFYIVAGGDAKAVGGQDEVRAMLEADGVPFSYKEDWDAQAEGDELDALVADELSEGNDINMIRWRTGSVLGDSGMGMEHMASFDYAYRLDAVRDWLFSQSRE